MGANEIVRVPKVESRWYQFTDDGLLIEGGALLRGEKEQLVWAKENNLTLFRNMIFQNYPEYLGKAFESDPVEALTWYRMLRSVTPVLNLISKKLDVLGAGLSTLAKIRSSVEKAYDLGAPRRIVAFGVANKSHIMAYHPDIRLCVDTNASSEGIEKCYFVEGDLMSWRDYVFPDDMIISDCSTGSEDAAGMYIPSQYYRVYKEMVASGHFVLCKINKFCVPWEENWSVASLCFYREHNLEAFALISPNKEDNIYSMQEFDLHDGMRSANDSRMYKILSRRFDTNGIRLNYRDTELGKALGLASVVYNTGEKNYSVLNDVFNRFSSELGREWRKLCMDREPVLLDFDVLLAVDVEFPCILMDVEFMAADKERLFASFYKQCEMEWYDEVGWVAIERKIDK